MQCHFRTAPAPGADRKKLLILCRIAKDESGREQYQCGKCADLVCFRDNDFHKVTEEGRPVRLSSVADAWAWIESHRFGPYTVCKLRGICPLSLVDDESAMLFHDAMRALNHSWLPESGGYLDQSARFCRAFEIVSGEMTREKVKK